MAGNLSDYAESKLLDHVLGGPAFAQPGAFRIALFTADPGEAGPGTEVSGGAYARVALGAPSGAGSSRSNAGDITFPIASADWGVVTHVALFDAANLGNMLWHGPLNASKNIQNGDQFVIAAGDLTFSLD